MRQSVQTLGLVFLILLPVLLFWGCQGAKNKVYFVPSLHGLHKTNTKYTYDSLRQIIAGIDPDIIAVEIRPNDMGKDTIYLSRNYPNEMWKMSSWFPGTKVVGFDWLGADIEDKVIPDNYWQEVSQVKRMERELAKDSVYGVKRAGCAYLVDERLRILKHSSLKEILNSEDSQLTKRYYNCVRDTLKGSKYEWLFDFYDKRNERLLANIKEIIKNNKNKTIVIVTGDDHFVYLKDRFPNKKIFKE